MDDWLECPVCGRDVPEEAAVMCSECGALVCPECCEEYYGDIVCDDCAQDRGWV